MIQIFDRDWVAVPIQDGVLHLEENKRYTVVGVSEAHFGERELALAVEGWHFLEVGYWGAARSELSWRTGESKGRVPVAVSPNADKLPSGLWLELLQDLEAWLPAITVGLEGGRSGAVSTLGATSPFLAEAVLPLIPDAHRALVNLCAHLRRRTTTQIIDVPLWAARQVRGETISWLTKHPATSCWVDPDRFAEEATRQPLLPHRLPTDALDHPANRYVRWMVERVCKVLDATAEALKVVQTNEDAIQWCRGRARRLELAAGSFRRLLMSSPLRDVAPEPPSEAALAVVLDDPVYARAHRILRLFLSPLFRPTDGERPAPVRTSFNLYEIWCLLSVQRSLAQAIPDWHWQWTGLDALLRLNSTGAGTAATAMHPLGHCLRIAFNLEFPGYVTRRNSPRWSISGERRPDIVITWKPANGSSERTSRWFVADAKYRAGAMNLADAFTSAHIYHDALRWPEFGGACAGALLLCPTRSLGTETWFDAQFLKENAVGIIELRPGGKTNDALAQWVVKDIGV